MKTDGCRLNLQSEVISQHWREVSDTLSRLLILMDSKDSWVIDSDPEFLDLLASLVSQCEDASFAGQVEGVAQSAQLVEVFALLCSSRFIRVLEMLDRSQPGFVSRLTVSIGRVGGESEVFASLYYERLLIVHRCELLGQIFSPARIERIARNIKLFGGDMNE